MSKSKYHTPKVSKIHATSLGPEDRPKEFAGITSDDGLVHMRLEADVVIDRLARDIYTSPTAGIREIYNNEARQCRTAQKEHNAQSPTIHIQVDAAKRSLSILGTDSMGMSMQTFRDVYTVVGRSGNTSGTESGQFGFGRLASRLLSDVVIVQTYSRDTNEQFGFISKDGRAFEPIKMPALESFGTKISMTVKEDVSLYELVKYAHEMARFVKVDTVLCLEDDIVENPDYSNPHIYKQGIYSIGNVSERDYLAKELNITFEKNVDWLEFDTKEYYFLGAITDGYGDITCQHHNLVGIPIHMEPLEIKCAGYILNIKDERKYLPTVSRDNLIEQAELDIREKISKEFDRIMESIKISTIDDYLNCKYKVIARKYNILSVYDTFNKDTREFAELSKLQIRSHTRDAEKKIECSYKKALKGLDSIHPQPEKNVVYALATIEARMNAIFDIIPDAKIIVLTHRESDQWRQIFEKFGIRNITEILKEHNIKIQHKKKEEHITEVMTYNMQYGHHQKSDIQDLTCKDIRIPRGEDIRHYISLCGSNDIDGYRIFKDRPKVTQGIALDEFISKVKNTTYSKEGDSVTGKKILESINTSVLLDDTNKYSEKLTLEICKKYNVNANMLIRGTKQSLDELRVASILCGRESYFDNADDEKQIGQAMAAHLKIKYDGIWIEDYLFIQDTLSKISSRHTREMYVTSYEKLFSTIYRSTSSYGYNRNSDDFTSLYERGDRDVLGTLADVFVTADGDGITSKKKSTVTLLQQCIITAKNSPDKCKILSNICNVALEYCFEKNKSDTAKHGIMLDAVLYTLSLYGYGTITLETKKHPYKSDIRCIKISSNVAPKQFSFDTKNWNKMFCIDELRWELDSTSVYSDPSETYVIVEVRTP